MKAVIRGMGLIGSFGVGRDALRQTLLSGQETVSGVSVPGRESMPAYLADVSRLRDYANSRALRRTNRFSQLTALSAILALEDAGLYPDFDPQRTGLILATGHGAATSTCDFLDSALEDGDSYVSPMVFSNSVHASAMSNSSILLGLRGPCLTVHQMEMSVPMALLSGLAWLAEDRIDHLLLCSCDEYCEMIGYCHAQLLSPACDKMQPQNRRKQTALPGESAVCLVLQREADGSGTTVRAPVYSASREQTAGARIFGLDGHVGTARHYPDSSPDLCFTSAYGSQPTGMALDIAIAALLLDGSSVVHHVFGSTPTSPRSFHVYKANRTGRVATVCVEREA